MAPGMHELLQKLVTDFPQVPQQQVQQVVAKHGSDPSLCSQILSEISMRTAFNPMPLGGVIPPDGSRIYHSWQTRQTAPLGSGSYVVRKNKQAVPSSAHTGSAVSRVPASGSGPQLTVRVQRSIDDSEDSSGSVSPRRKSSQGSPGFKITSTSDRLRPDSPLVGQRAHSKSVGPGDQTSVSVHLPSGLSVTRQDSDSLRSSDSFPSLRIIDGGQQINVTQASSNESPRFALSQPRFVAPSTERRQSAPHSPLPGHSREESSVFDTPNSENSEVPSQIFISFGSSRRVAQQDRPTVTFGPLANVQQVPDQSSMYLESLLHHQRNRKTELEEAIRKVHGRLEELRSDVETMESDLLQRRKQSVQSSSSFLTPDTVQALHQETRRLQADVNTMNREVRIYRDERAATNTFDTSTFSADAQTLQAPVGTRNEKPKSPFGRLMKHFPGAGSRGKSQEDVGKDDSWSCGACTFLNHPALSHCEVCEMPRVRVRGSEPAGSWRCYCCPDSDTACEEQGTRYSR